MSQISINANMSQPTQLSFISQASELTELSPVNLVTQQDESDLSSATSATRGWINEHFRKIIVGAKRFRLCMADSCSKQYSAGTSTVIFKTHWRKEHSATTDLKKTVFMFHDHLHTNRLVKAVIALHLDYSIVDKPEFRAFTQSLNPNKHIICRKTLANLINGNRVNLAARVREKLENAESVALTFDIWSVRKGARGFGCVTAHYISSFGRLENLILHFERMNYPHDAETISKFITEPIVSFKLEGKIAAITTDNASNNIAAIRLIDASYGLTSVNLGFIHYKCMAHILDLGMKVAMKDLKDIVRPVRDAVMAIRSSRKRKEKFFDKQRELIDGVQQNSTQPLELAEDVDHRWNSLFVLLERAYLLRDAVDFMIETTKGMEHIEPVDWTTIQLIISFLHPFDEATKRLCHASEVTISIVSIITPRLIEHCVKNEVNVNSWISKSAKSMRQKLTDYELEVYQPVVDVACVLDPRYKTKYLSDDHRKLVLDRIREILDRMPAPTNDSVVSETSLLGCDSDSEEQVDELSLYCESRREKVKCDVISWWKHNAELYPKLSALARQILPIQGTSVASERVFSVAGDVDTKSRNRLSDESVENIVLFKSWMQYLNIE